MKLSGPAKLLLVACVLVPVAHVFYNNPIHFHQAVKVTDYTLDLPLFWAQTDAQRPEMIAAFRREWANSATVDIVDRARVNPTLGMWTQESAERARGLIVAIEQKDPRFSGQRFFDADAGRFRAICTESKLGDDQAFTCYVIGTRLQFSYIGQKPYEPSALQILASLH